MTSCCDLNCTLSTLNHNDRFYYKSQPRIFLVRMQHLGHFWQALSILVSSVTQVQTAYTVRSATLNISTQNIE